MGGPVNDELEKRGCEDLGSGWWSHPEHEGGTRRMGREEAIAWTLQSEGARLREGGNRYEERIEQFQKWMDAIRTALGLTCTYSEMPEAARALMEAKAVSRPQPAVRLDVGRQHGKEFGAQLHGLSQEIEAAKAAVDGLRTDMAAHEEAIGTLMEMEVAHRLGSRLTDKQEVVCRKWVPK